MNHARFRLDSPVIAGGPFFEMVDFFLGELRRLRQDARVVPRPLSADDTSAAQQDSADWESVFGTRAEEGYELIVRPSRSTTYYVSELYLAVMLYAVNCFGEGAITDAAPLLRRWAFAPPWHSVRAASIDLHSTGRVLFPAAPQGLAPPSPRSAPGAARCRSDEPWGGRSSSGRRRSAHRVPT